MRYIIMIFFILCASLFAQSNIDEDSVHFIGQASAFTVGAELVTNGDFAADSGWTKGTGWTTAGGDADCDGSAGADTELLSDSAITTVTGTVYRVQFEVTAFTAGNVVAVFDSVEVGGDKAAVGVYTAYVAATDASSTVSLIGDLDFVGSCDNVSVVAWVGDLNAGGGCTIDTFSGTLTDYMGAAGGVLHNDSGLALSDSSGLIAIASGGAWDTTPAVGTLVKCDFSALFADGIYTITVASSSSITIDLQSTGLGAETVEVWIGGAYPDIATAMNDSTLSQGPVKLSFTSGGTYVMKPGDEIDGDDSGATATILGVDILTGSFAGGDAVGNLFITVPTVASFQAEQIDVAANNDVADVIAAENSFYRKRYISVNVDQEVDAVTDFVAETSETALREDDGSRKIIGFYDSISVVTAHSSYCVVSDIDEGQTYYSGARKAFNSVESFSVINSDGKWIEWNAKGNAINILELNTYNFEMRNMKLYNTATGGTYSILHYDTGLNSHAYTNCWFGDADRFNVDDEVALYCAFSDCYFDKTLATVNFTDINYASFMKSIFNLTGKTNGVAAPKGCLFDGCLFYKGNMALNLPVGSFVANSIFFDQTVQCAYLTSSSTKMSAFYNTIFSPAAAADIAIDMEKGAMAVGNFNNIMYSATAGAALTNPIVHDQITPNPPLPVGTLEVDPLFVNPADGDFRLRVSSPALNGGLGSLFGGRSTIGAWQPYALPSVRRVPRPRYMGDPIYK